MSSKIMFTELRRVCSNGYMHYIPEFNETFPELKNVSNEKGNSIYQLFSCFGKL